MEANMSKLRGMAVAGLLAAFPMAAQATIAFSFADPGPGHQFTNTANGAGPGLGMLSYNTNQVISLIVDGAAESAITMNNVHLEMTTLTLGAASTNNGVTTAPVSGSFTFYDMTNGTRTNIVSASVPQGSFVRIGGTSALLFSSQLGLQYTAGPILQNLLEQANLTLSNPEEAAFTLTDITVANNQPLFNSAGVFNSFTANSSYSGNVGTVPTPGSLGILLVAAGAFARRSRGRSA
jgi:hypothetical protein